MHQIFLIIGILSLVFLVSQIWLMFNSEGAVKKLEKSITPLWGTHNRYPQYTPTTCGIH